VQAAVLGGGVVEDDVDRDVAHGERSRPVREILVPGDHSRMPRGLVEHLALLDPVEEREVRVVAAADPLHGLPDGVERSTLEDSHSRHVAIGFEGAYLVRAEA
jgi:hypothetical protein